MLILSPTEQGLADFRGDPRWIDPADTPVAAWTDDYVNLFGAIQRRYFPVPAPAG